MVRTGRPGLYLRADAAQAEVSFRNFRFSPIWAFAPIPQMDAPHIIAAAQIFFDQTGSDGHGMSGTLSTLVDFSFLSLLSGKM